MNDMRAYEFVFERYFSERHPAIYVTQLIEAVNEMEAINSFQKSTENLSINRIVSIKEIS